MIHATHGVITNARMDHLDEMGPTYDDVVNSLLNTRPRNGKLYFGDHSLEKTHRSAGHHSRDLSEWIEKFKYQEHEENINVALDICYDWAWMIKLHCAGCFWRIQIRAHCRFCISKTTGI